MTELTLDYGEAYVAHWEGGCKCGAANWYAGDMAGLPCVTGRRAC